MPAAPKTLEDYHAPYPKPTADQKRFVIFLDDKGEDCELDDYKLQLIPGRVMKVDPVNAHVIGGTVKEEEISGWGYNYYVVEMGQAASTLMGVPKDAEYVERFVQMVDTPFIRYNSKLPVVVYMPKDGQLRYRVWKPEEKESIAAVEQ